jgi:hypothetical protein
MNDPNERAEDVQRREWQVQERARKEERHGAEPSDDVNSASDSRTKDGLAYGGTAKDGLAKYRLIARALRQPPIGSLSESFAAETAAQIEAMNSAISDSVEIWLQRALLTLLLVTGTATAVIFGGEWLTALVSRVFALGHSGPGKAGDWIVAVAVCLTLSLGVELGLRRRQLRPAGGGA